MLAKIVSIALVIKASFTRAAAVARRAGGAGYILMAPAPALEQDFQNFSAPTPAPELAIFLLWLRLRLFLI